MVFDKFLLEENVTQTEEIVFVSEKYLVEIITGVKIDKDKSLMSFKRLFDTKVIVFNNLFL